ncbi:Hint domain-containing protein [Paracoccus sp. p3-h83]|uniref:Hint domain-containing protein n=1 Tax=Paracoccus sp. p3-h83 TaxID=3342805 RepID=UPI0035BAB920
MANIYVVGNNDTTTNAASLVGTPYEGYQIVKVSTISNPYAIGSYKFVTGGDNVVIGSTVNSDVVLQPGSNTTGFNVNVTVLGNSNTFNVDVGTRAGLNYTEPNVTYNVVGQSGNVSIGGADNTQVQTVKVADGAAIGNITGGGDANDHDVVISGAGSKVGNVSLGGGDDSVTIGGKVGTIDTGDGNDAVTLNTGATSGTINTGNGNDAISVTGSTITGGIAGGEGADTVSVVNSTVSGNISTGNLLGVDIGNDVLLVDGTKVGGVIETGGGNDRATITGASTVGSNGTQSVGMGSGDDALTVGADVIFAGNVRGDSGTDTITIETATSDERQQLVNVMNDEGFPVTMGPDAKVVPYTFTTDADSVLHEFDWKNRWFSEWEAAAAPPPCFASGTLIATPTGTTRIEDLRVGDPVITRDHGIQPIRWIASRAMRADELAAAPHLRPIRIGAGALGAGLPETDLVVSPQHRVLVRSAIAQRMFGTDEILVAAKHLTTLPGIGVAEDLTTVTYHHMLFDAHEVVISNGAETESLFTGPEALKSVGPAAVAEILTLFPELAAATPRPARPLAPGRLARSLARRHAAHHKPLVN